MKLARRMGVFFLFLGMVTVVAAQTYSIDIAGIQSEEYAVGTDMELEVLLLEGTALIDGTTTLTLEDALKKKQVTHTVPSNTRVRIPIEADFTGGLWTITAQYQDATVERDFVVGENQEVSFKIDGDELIITNVGNSRYTRTIEITIGDVSNSYAQNLGAGEEKRLTLISPEGQYDLIVTDGKTTLKKQNIQLFGTGNVIGAVDTELVGYTGFAGADDVATARDKGVNLSKLPLSLTFIAAIFILGILVFAERKLAKKRKRR